MKNEHYNTIIKISINCFKYSFILGTLIYASYIITRNSDLIFFGFIYLVLAVIINIVMLATLLITLIALPENRLKTLKTIGVLIINMPVAYLYYWSLSSGIFRSF